MPKYSVQLFKIIHHSNCIVEAIYFFSIFTKLIDFNICYDILSHPIPNFCGQFMED